MSVELYEERVKGNEPEWKKIINGLNNYSFKRRFEEFKIIQSKMDPKLIFSNDDIEKFNSLVLIEYAIGLRISERSKTSFFERDTECYASIDKMKNEFNDLFKKYNTEHKAFLELNTKEPDVPKNQNIVFTDEDF
jgi:hypothetical protein